MRFWTSRYFLTAVLVHASMTMIVACGVAQFAGRQSSSTEKSDNGSTAVGPGIADPTANATANGGGTASGDYVKKEAAIPSLASDSPSGAPSTGGGTQVGLANIGLSSGDKAIVESCLAGWPGNPFAGAAKVDFKEIKPVSTTGQITSINDDLATQGPQLILIDGITNVGSILTYNFMNPNGYYCLKHNSDTGTILKINLACSAYLAGPDTGVAIGSIGSIPALTHTGTNVGSIVQLARVTSNGAACPK